jgi:hypothetical protein
MPGCLDPRVVGFDQSPGARQRGPAQTVIICDLDGGPKPELRFAVTVFDVDMRWFARVALVRVEEKPKSFGPEYDRHAGIADRTVRSMHRSAPSAIRFFH